MNRQRTYEGRVIVHVGRIWSLISHTGTRLVAWLVAAGLAWSLAPAAWAQVSPWSFELIQPITPILGCGPGIRLGGFEYDPIGRPVITWTEENLCTFPGKTFHWSRQEAGVWTPRHIVQGREPRGVAALAVRPIDGVPFLISSWAAGDCFGDPCQLTYRSDLSLTPTGQGVEIEVLGNYRSADTSHPVYVARFRPGTAVPDWLTLASHAAYVRLNGFYINHGAGAVPAADLAIGPDGQRHIVYTEEYCCGAGTTLFYTSLTDPIPAIRENIPRIAILDPIPINPLDPRIPHARAISMAVDRNGWIHMALTRTARDHCCARCLDYMVSRDGGQTWGATILETRVGFEDHNEKVSLALDADGNPAIAYWIGRDTIRFAWLRNGVWSQSTQTGLDGIHSIAIRLTFTPGNAPVILFYDKLALHLVLARPVSTNQPPVVTNPVDQRNVEGNSPSLQILATDPDGNALTYSTGLPPGLRIDPATGLITGTLGFDSTGIYQVTVSVFDGTDIARVTFSWTVGDNQAPTANAGLDQAVDEGTRVSLDGSGSTDPENRPLTYTWRQLAGTLVTLTLTDPARPSFDAPTVPPGGETLTFELTVCDSEPKCGALDIMNLMVRNVNKAPQAGATIVGATTDPAVVKEGSLIVLDGSSSHDPDSEPLSFYWRQTVGTPVVLFNSATIQPSFTAPAVGPVGETLTFELTVTDPLGATGTDTVNVFVENVNHAPVANAGPDQTQFEGSLVTLNAGGSVDPDGDALSYRWTQVVGVTTVVLSNPAGMTPTFVAPLVGPGGETLVFALVATDILGASSTPDTVRVLVQNVNDSPVCTAAKPSPLRLWPPNHKLLPVGIVGVTKSDNNTVTITITRVTQDEPVNGLGDGDTSPDAVIQGSTVLLRAERSSLGNGRVYRVYFTADNGHGTCTYFVRVGVPHDMKPGRPLIDDGLSYDSTLP